MNHQYIDAILNLDEVPKVHLCLCFFRLWRHILKEVAVADIKEVTPYVLLKDSDGFLSHVEVFYPFRVIFVYGVREWSSFILLHRAVQFPRTIY